MGYNSDLTNKQWELIEPIFKSNKGRHLVEHSKRDLINAVLYLVKTGCQWRMIPNDFPPSDTVMVALQASYKIREMGSSNGLDGSKN